ncbi:hypothetical protein CcCBS67573_g03530 [Chytriomyces confervae]|uniref:Uncharacterized protein n=1 Tax=Chytriomyces confervae TaxID=246404 RepID=A0A507FFT1_9FUNG|nr:hypothetical protein CcCBS67573_g03530 [Chytriomyces confervae]
MDANYLKHAIGPALNAALSSLLSYPHPTQITDPVAHADKLEMQKVASDVEAERLRIKAITDCKRRIGMSLGEAIAKMEQRGSARKAKLDEEDRLKKESEEQIEVAPVVQVVETVEPTEVVSEEEPAAPPAPEFEEAEEEPPV